MRGLILTLAFVAATAVAHAQTPTIPLPESNEPPPPADSTKVMNGVTIAEVEAIVKAAGYEYQSLTGSYGPYLEVKSKDGYKYEVSLADCPETGEARCGSVNMLSYAFNETPKVTLKGVNDWNNKAWGVRGMLYKDGTSGVSMNVGVNGGVTAAWLVNRLGNFDYWLTSFGDFVAGAMPPAPAPATP